MYSSFGGDNVSCPSDIASSSLLYSKDTQQISKKDLRILKLVLE